MLHGDATLGVSIRVSYVEAARRRRVGRTKNDDANKMQRKNLHLNVEFVNLTLEKVLGVASYPVWITTFSSLVHLLRDMENAPSIVNILTFF
jgi:hypothetical protein